MKLSNKTLIVFFGVILSYTLMAFAEIRFKGDYEKLTEDNSIAESLPVRNLKYLVISEDLNKQVTITSSENSRMELKSQSGKIMSKVTYEFKNDTLYLHQIDMGENEEHFHVTIFIKENQFEGLSSTSSNVKFLDISQASLSITQSGGRITFERGMELDRLNITEKDEARFTIYNARLDTVAIDLDDSELGIRSEVKRLEGVLTNKASMSSDGADDVQLKKDKRSSIRMFD